MARQRGLCAKYWQPVNAIRKIYDSIVTRPGPMCQPCHATETGTVQDHDWTAVRVQDSATDRDAPPGRALLRGKGCGTILIDQAGAPQHGREIGVFAMQFQHFTVQL